MGKGSAEFPCYERKGGRFLMPTTCGALQAINKVGFVLPLRDFLTYHLIAEVGITSCASASRSPAEVVRLDKTIYTPAVLIIPDYQRFAEPAYSCIATSLSSPLLGNGDSWLPARLLIFIAANSRKSRSH